MVSGGHGGAGNRTSGKRIIGQLYKRNGIWIRRFGCNRKEIENPGSPVRLLYSNQ